MNPRIALLLFSISSLLLSGCVGGMVTSGLQALDGEPVDNAFRVIGYPTSKMEIGKDTLYSWDLGRGGVNFVPSTATSMSMVGTTPIYTTTTMTHAVPTYYTGNIRIRANPKGIINDWSWEGQNGALMSVASRLDQYAKAKNKRLAAEAAVASGAAASPPLR